MAYHRARGEIKLALAQRMLFFTSLSNKELQKSPGGSYGSQMRNYSIAVVIPAYNAELYICDALDSIMLQSRRPEQIIIVDDGSTDHTLERIHNWQRQYNGELCLLQQSHSGVSAARNTGIQHTTADLIAFLDADDLFLSHHLEQLERAFKNHPDLSWPSGILSILIRNRF